MRFNKLFWALISGSFCFTAQAEPVEPTAWGIFVEAKNAAYWEQASLAAQSRFNYLELKKRLKNISEESLPTDDEFIARLQDLGLQVEGGQVVIPAPIIQRKPTPSSTKDPVFHWSKASLGMASGQVYVELKSNSTGRLLTVRDGELVDEWRVVIRGSVVSVEKDGFTRVL